MAFSAKDSITEFRSSIIPIHGTEGYDVEYRPMGNQMTKKQESHLFMEL